MNASWGFQNLPGFAKTPSSPTSTRSVAAGIAVVFAAGNTGPGGATSISPANNAGAIAVGSVDDLNVIDPTSARGPSTCDARIYPDAVAPGDTIKTTDLSFGGFPFYVAAPDVLFGAACQRRAGIVAERVSERNAGQLKSALTGSAADLGAVGPDNVYGNGLVNAAAAYASLGAPCIRPQVDFTCRPVSGYRQPVDHLHEHRVRRYPALQLCLGFQRRRRHRLRRRRVFPHLRECLQRLGGAHGYGC